MAEPRLHHRVCNLCEAMCGITVEHDGERVLSIRGDKEDTFSEGHLCPKAVALKDVHEDPDRLRRPQKRVDGRFVEIGWDQAFDEIGERLHALRRAHGNDAVAIYHGNPTVHNYGSLIYGVAFAMALRTSNRYSATSVDQLPRMLTSFLMYGHQLLLPVPDVDRTMYFLMLGANPLASNGSLMTAPGIERRLKKLKERGGKLVVVDPRRTETAELASEHLFIRPGSDALFLLALSNVLFSEGLVRPGRLAPWLDGLDAARAVAMKFAPERVAAATGIDATTIRRVAREFAAGERSVAYGRVGVCLAEFGTLATWATDLLNVLTGNLDREGGSMFTSPAVDVVALASAGGLTGSYGTFKSRARGLPEFGGELPVATLCDEIETPGAGQVRALFTSCGNPVLSTPNGARLARAIAKLELVVSIDIYKNETTRLAHYLLPPTFALEHDNYEAAFHLIAVRNTARYSPPLFAPPPDSKHDWQIFVELMSRLGGTTGAAGLGGKVARLLGAKVSPARLLDVLLRTGPYGDKFLPFKKGLSLKRLEKETHGVDLGPLVPRFPDALHTESQRIALAPAAVLGDVMRLEKRLEDWSRPVEAGSAASLSLIGRRDLRSNNSWMHNSLRLVKGPPRCTLFIHPADAAERGIAAGDEVVVRSRVGEVVAPAVLTDEVMRGVVSLPHGWGHDREGAELRVASAHAGVSMNDVTDERHLDALSGNASLNGVPVTVERRAKLKVAPETRHELADRAEAVPA